MLKGVKRKLSDVLSCLSGVLSRLRGAMSKK